MVKQILENLKGFLKEDNGNYLGTTTERIEDIKSLTSYGITEKGISFD
jgi:hypothetical protein